MLLKSIGIHTSTRHIYLPRAAHTNKPKYCILKVYTYSLQLTIVFLLDFRVGYNGRRKGEILTLNYSKVCIINTRERNHSTC